MIMKKIPNSKFHIHKSHVSRRGFTVYFAVLIASLSLTIGLAIYDLVSRELLLSQVATQSQYAIYAADTGIECALYWDFHYEDDEDGSAFATSSNDTWPSTGSDLMCAGLDITESSWNVTTASQAATTTFAITVGTNSCAEVIIAKRVGTATTTVITSEGRNTTNCATAGPAGILRVERALQVNY